MDREARRSVFYTYCRASFETSCLRARGKVLLNPEIIWVQSPPQFPISGRGKGHQSLGMPAFFCDPHNSGQKGSIENGNKMIRRYFPKGTDFQTVSQEDINLVVSIINSKPRKILGYRTALEVARQGGILLKGTAWC